MEDSASILELKGIGEKSQKLFAKVNIRTLGDLLYYYPRDYEMFREPVPLSQARTGEVCAVQAMVCGTVNMKKVRSLTLLNVLVRDDSGGMQLTFFNMPFLKNVLKPGSRHIFRGRVQARGTALVMEQPRIYKPEEYAGYLAFIQPRYALTKGLTNQAVQKAVKQLLTGYTFGPDPYPESLRRQYNLMERREAIHNMHFPVSYEELVKARRRVVFEEFFSFLYLLRENREQCKLLENEYRMLETADTGRLLEPAISADRGSDESLAGDLPGPVLPLVHEPAGTGGRGVRQNHHRGAGSAHVCRQRFPGSHDGAHGGAGSSALRRYLSVCGKVSCSAAASASGGQHDG